MDPTAIMDPRLNVGAAIHCLQPLLSWHRSARCIAGLAHTCAEASINLLSDSLLSLSQSAFRYQSHFIESYKSSHRMLPLWLLRRKSKHLAHFLALNICARAQRIACTCQKRSSLDPTAPFFALKGYCCHESATTFRERMHWATMAYSFWHAEPVATKSIFFL